jgi:hypothetical protein
VVTQYLQQDFPSLAVDFSQALIPRLQLLHFVAWHPIGVLF